MKIYMVEEEKSGECFPTNYGFYTEKEFCREKKVLFLEFELGQHSVNDVFPVIHGWTPRYRFEEKGFKKEYEIDLLQIEQKMVRGDGVAYFQARGVPAGTRELFGKHKEELENAFTKLNKKGIAYLVFRSYRHFPPWDNIICYSREDLRDR